MKKLILNLVMKKKNNPLKVHSFTRRHSSFQTHKKKEKLEPELSALTEAVEEEREEENQDMVTVGTKDPRKINQVKKGLLLLIK